MEPFFPFIHENPKKDISEPLPLYIELIPPTIEEADLEPESEEPRVIILELF